MLPAGGFGNFDHGIIIARGQGSRVWDEDGAEYVDYLIGSGPMLLGHGHPEVMEAVFEQLPTGMTYFANNAKGIELAEAIVEAVPCCEQVRFVTSGGEREEEGGEGGVLTLSRIPHADSTVHLLVDSMVTNTTEFKLHQMPEQGSWIICAVFFHT